MSDIPWIIAGIIAPVPLFHLWLHAMLGYWRKFPLLFYVLGGIAWAVSLFLFRYVGENAADFFVPAKFVLWAGYGLIVIGIIGIFSSMVTLGARRFFVWAVLRPNSVPAVHIRKGPFSFLPHPAYFGYLAAAFGNFLSSGKLYALVVFLYLIAVIPIVIHWEEEELKKRTGE